MTTRLRTDTQVDEVMMVQRANRSRSRQRASRPTVTALVQSIGQSLAVAWQLRPTRQGVVGTSLLALGSLTPAYLPQNSPWWVPLRAMGLDQMPVTVLGTILVIVGVALLIDAWFRLRPSVYVGAKHWAILAIWSLPLLFAPPIFSHDAYSYAAQGWLIYNGLNPYEVGPGVLPGAFADQVSWVWRYTPAPYGPLSLEISNLLVRVAGLNPYYSALLHRIPALLGVGLIVYFLPRLAVRLKMDAQSTAWFSTINPLLVIDLVGGAHNDALMVGLVVLAVWLAFEKKFLVACVVIGVSTAIKQPAILAAYPVALIGHPWIGWKARETWRMVRRVATSFAIAGATFALISVASGLNFGWMNAVGVPGMVLSLAPFTLLGWGIQTLIDLWHLDPSRRLALDIARGVGLASSAVVIAYLALTTGRRKPVNFLSWAYLAAAFGGPALHSWYLSWGGLWLPLTAPSERVTKTAVVVTAVLLGYAAANFAWRNDAIALTFGASVLILTLLWVHVQVRRSHEPSATDQRS